ncbi:MAG: hypothetical protein V1824_03895 [archaeon]
MSDNSTEEKLDKTTKELYLSLADYNDLFSDFDPRDYAVREISDDLITELKRQLEDFYYPKVTLNLYLKNHIRNQNEEKIIKKRLIEHFVFHENRYKIERKKILLQGIIFNIIGISLIVFSGFLALKSGEKNSLFTALDLALQPIGWFLFWEGSNLLIFELKKYSKHLGFYKSISNCKINFLDKI